MRLRSHSKFAFDKLPPELRVHIHSFLKDDRATLVNAIRVNKEWFHRLTGLLWREPGFGALLCPAKRGRRRQFYADKIRTLSLEDSLAGFQNGSPVHWKHVLSTCEMPYLEHLQVNSHDVVPDEFSCPLLRPSLLSVKLPLELSTSALETLSLCTRLKHLVVAEDVEISDLEFFMNVIMKLPSLDSIELGGDIFTSSKSHPHEQLHTNEVFARLLKHGRLTHLELGKYMSEGNAREISNLLDNTLPGNKDLTTLCIGGHYEALDLFLANTVTSLRTLEITVPGDYKDSNRDLCEDILRFTNLTELCLCMWPEQVLHLNDLTALTKMKHLQVIKITSYWPEDLPGSSWTNDDFSAWISHFPQLRELELLCETSPSSGESAVAAIGRSCPELERCTLGWAQDLSTWTTLVNDASVLFPKLKRLGVHNIDDEFEELHDFASPEDNLNGEWMQEGLKQLKTILKLAPRLETVALVDVGQWGINALQTGLESLQKPHCEDCRVWNLDKEVIAKLKEDADIDGETS
ncbi:hypothetical protein KCU65_g1401, partial [Aureobasidium melanogenum]